MLEVVLKLVFKSRGEQRLLFIGKAQSLKNPSVSFPNLGQKNAHLLSLKIPPALRCCIMCHYIRWRGRRGGPGGRMPCGGQSPFLKKTETALQSARLSTPKAEPPPPMPYTGLEAPRESYYLRGLQSGAPKYGALVITDVHLTPTWP